MIQLGYWKTISYNFILLSCW